MSRDFYKILNLTRNASASEIKKNYHDLAKKHHPDKNPNDPDAARRFQEIGQAYEALGDPKKKSVYDQMGEEGLNQMNTQSMHPGMHPGMPPWMAGIHPGVNPFEPQRKVHKLKHQIKLTDYFTNYKTMIKIPRDQKCDKCDATGYADGKFHPCKKCGGSGRTRTRIQLAPGMIQQMDAPCPQCNGQRKDNTDPTIACVHCKGRGNKKIYENLEVDIPKCIITNPITIVPEGYTTQGQKMDLAVIFQLKLGKDYGFTNDHKLIHIMHLNLTETLCGFKRLLLHPNGKKILITSSPGYVISPHYVYSINGLGLYEGFNGESDELYLSFVVNYPDTISLPKKKALTWLTLETSLGAKHIPDTDTENTDYDLSYNLKDLPKTNNDPKATSDQQSDDDESNDKEEDLDDDETTTEIPGPSGCHQQ